MDTKKYNKGDPVKFKNAYNKDKLTVGKFQRHTTHSGRKYVQVGTNDNYTMLIPPHHIIHDDK